MAIGKLKNRLCPSSHRINAKGEEDTKGYIPKWKKCFCWNQNYWAGFSKSTQNVHVKEKLHGKPVEYDKEVTRYFIPTRYAAPKPKIKKVKIKPWTIDKEGNRVNL